MNTFIRTAACCLLLSVGLAGALVSYEAYCEACVKESQQASLFPHPNRCDQYIQCVVSGNITLAYVQACPPSTFFNMTLRNCVSQVAHCNETCTSGSRFKAIGSCNNYYECVNGKFDSTQKSCPSQFAVDPNTGACVSDPNCPPPNMVGPVDCSAFSVDSNPQVYYHNGTRQSCALGQVFNLTTCTCQLAAGPVKLPTSVCTLYDVPMLTDFDEVSAGRSVLNNGAVIQNGAAYFRGASLVLPGFILNDFADKIQIDVDVMYENPTKNEIPVLNNANCDLESTISLTLKDALTSNCYLEAAIKVQNEPQQVKITTPVSANVWNSFTFTKKGDKITLLKNGVQAGQATQAGNFEFQDSAMVAGKAPQKTPFQGYMKNLRISKCPA